MVLARLNTNNARCSGLSSPFCSTRDYPVYEVKSFPVALPQHDLPVTKSFRVGASIKIVSHEGTHTQKDSDLQQQLTTPSAVHLDEAFLGEEQAKDAFNSIIAHAEVGDLIQARGMYDVLVALSIAYPDKESLRDWQSKGAVNLLCYYGQAGDLTQVRNLYDGLVAQSAAHHDKAHLRDYQARGAVNLIAAYGKAGDLTQARGMYDALATLSSDHPDEVPLRKQQAWGAFNLINAYGQAGDLTQARGMYDTIVALSATPPDEVFLREVQAKGAYSLTCYCDQAGDLVQARMMYDTLTVLAIAHPDESFLWDLQRDAFNRLVANRLEEFYALQDGWLDGEGRAPGREGLDWFASTFDNHYPKDLPLPYLYPTAEGGIQVEWTMGVYEISLDVDLEVKQAEWQDLNMATDKEVDKTLNLTEENDWSWLVDRLCALAAEGNA